MSDIFKPPYLVRQEAIRKVVNLCESIPGSTQWNAAEFVYDELMKGLSAPQDHLTQGGEVDVDELAQEIRRVDGNHSLGAGALAEALLPFLTRALAQQPLSVPAGWQLVPVEPTDAMIEAGRMARMNIQGGYGGPSSWEDMLSAAPTVGGKEEYECSSCGYTADPDCEICKPKGVKAAKERKE